jgi:hypothetical protein
MEIMTRHKDKVILYWFETPQSKTLRPVLDCIYLIVAKVEVVCRVHASGRVPLLALYWVMDKVDGPKSKSVTTGKPISSQLQHGKLIRAALICLDFLVLHAKLSSRLDKVVWGIF